MNRTSESEFGHSLGSRPEIRPVWTNCGHGLPCTFGKSTALRNGMQRAQRSTDYAPSSRVAKDKRMTSQARRNPITDPLLTPENAALVLIDYQPPQLNTIRSMDPLTLLTNTVTLAKVARLFKLPMVLSSVGVKTGVNPDTMPEIKVAMEGAASMDRTNLNAWEDVEFVKAVENTGRKKLIMGALWTEVCLVFPTLDAIRAGYEVFIPVDVVAGTSTLAHDAALQRAFQAGARPVSWIGVLCELQRDWAYEKTAAGMVSVAASSGGSWSTEIAIKQFSSQLAK